MFFFVQVVELDFAYPSEGIHKRWDAGEQIGSVVHGSMPAACIDQDRMQLAAPVA